MIPYTLTWNLPIRTVSEANSSEHWTAKSKRHKQQQFFIRALFKKHGRGITLPCKVTLIRLSPRTLDDDNLCMAFKWIRDEISECLIPHKKLTYITKKGSVAKIKGRMDSDHRITWKYQQEPSKVAAIRIEIDHMEPDL